MAGNILGSLLLNIVTKSDDSGLRKTDRSLRKIGTTARTVAKNTSLLGSLSKKMFGGFNIANISNAWNSYLQFEKDLGAMKSRFYAITHDEKESAEEFEYIRKLATDTALNIKNTADSYSIFYSATRQALGKEGARGVYEAWTKVGRVLHLNDYQMERVTYALREMASKGAIYSQDLRMQIGTHVPNAMGLAQKAAEEMGFTGVDWFTKLQEAAKGNTKLTAEFVQKFSKQAQAMYGSPEAFQKAMQQPDALVQKIKNIPYNFGVKFSQSGGSYMMVEILKGVVGFLEKIPVDDIAKKLGAVATSIGNMAKYIPQMYDVLKHMLIMLMFMKATSGVTSLLTSSLGRGAIFAIHQGKFWKWIGLKMMKPLGGVIGKSLLTFGAKSGLKGLLAVVVNGIPIIGQILSIIMLIWTAVDLIKLLMPKKEGLTAEKFAFALGLTPEQAQNIVKSVMAKGVTSQEDLDRKLMYYKGGEGLVGRLTYHDSSNITINIDGEHKDATQIANLTVEKLQQEKNKKGLFSKPVKYGVDLEARYGK